MKESGFRGNNVLVVGGAGFVGSALCRRVLRDEPARLTVVDNLLSAEIDNVPEHPAVDFRFGSITSERVLNGTCSTSPRRRSATAAAKSASVSGMTSRNSSPP